MESSDDNEDNYGINLYLQFDMRSTPQRMDSSRQKPEKKLYNQCGEDNSRTCVPKDPTEMLILP